MNCLGAKLCMAAVMVTGVGAVGQAQGAAAAGGQGVAPTPGTTVLLWPAGAPGAKGDRDGDKPTLTVYLPAGENATKTGVVVAPGGGYSHLSMVKEGEDIARWLNARGVAGFVLKYRLGPTYRNPIELRDAQRAIRMVRAHAAEWGVAPDHVGIWGFSAGGHLAATVGTQADAGLPGGTDTVDRQSSKPDFLVLAYPVITMQEPYVHGGSKTALLGEAADEATAEAMSAELRVTAETPPTILFATTDDSAVPVMNSVMFYEALVKAGVPAEMHLFQHGAHGAGLAAANPQLAIWPELVAKWMRERGYMAAGGSAVAAQ